MSLLAEIENAARNSWQVSQATAVDSSCPPDDMADLMIYLIPDADLQPFLADLAGVSHSGPTGRPSRGILVGFLNPGSSEKDPI
jgi:hypothetical protein